MTNQAPGSPAPNDEPSPQDSGNTISPLPGEAGIPNVARRQPLNLSWKNISVIGLVVTMVAGMSGLYLYRFIDHNSDADKDKSLLRDRPSAAGTGTRHGARRRAALGACAAEGWSAANRPQRSIFHRLFAP